MNEKKTGFENIDCFLFHDSIIESFECRENILEIMLGYAVIKACSAVNPKEASLTVPKLLMTAENFSVYENTVSDNIFTNEITCLESGGNTVTFYFHGENEKLSFSFDKLVIKWDEAYENALDYYLYAKKLFKSGDHDTVLSYLERSAAIEEHHSVYELMYRIFAGRGDKEKAFESISRAYSLRSRNDRNAYEYAEMLYSYSHDREKAVGILKELTKRNKTYKAASELLKRIENEQ